MDWQNERYVRLYTRTTADLLAIGWQGRLVWYELLRHADRAGVIDIGTDLEPGDELLILPEMLRVPPEVFGPGMRRIIARGMVTLGATALVIDNFQEAQEARQSDAMRQRESRAARRDKALARERIPFTSVTSCDIGERKPVGTVTASHNESHDVTPSLAVPSLAVPSLESRGVADLASEPGPTSQAGHESDQPSLKLDRASEPQPPPELKLEPPEAKPTSRAKPPGWSNLAAAAKERLAKHQADAEHLWRVQNKLRKQVAVATGLRALDLKGSASRLDSVAKCLEENSRDVCVEVLKQYAREARRSRSLKHLNGETNWVLKNFNRTAGMIGSPDPADPNTNQEPPPNETLEERNRRLYPGMVQV